MTPLNKTTAVQTQPPLALNQAALALESFLSMEKRQPLTPYSELVHRDRKPVGDVGRGGANTCIVVMAGKRGKETKSKVHCSALEGDKPVREFQNPVSPT